MKQNFECTYKSYERFGSIYTSPLSIVGFQDNLKRFGIKAIIDLSLNQRIQLNCPEDFEVLSLPISQTQSLQLKKSYDMAYQFIIKNKLKGNILICGHHKYLCLGFLFAYLMIKNSYSFTQIQKLYAQQIRNNDFPYNMLQQLKRLPAILQEKVRQQNYSSLNNSKIERRIKRIQFEYTNLSNNSRGYSRSYRGQNKKNYQSPKPTCFDFSPHQDVICFGELSPILGKKTICHFKQLSDIY